MESLDSIWQKRSDIIKELARLSEHDYDGPSVVIDQTTQGGIYYLCALCGAAGYDIPLTHNATCLWLRAKETTHD